MKEIFDQFSARISKQITNTYSTSFSKGIELLDRSIQPQIYAIYGFVRLADEIVDSFEGYPQQDIFERFEEDYRISLIHQISVHPVLNNFQYVVRQYELQPLVDQFLESMKMDLNHRNYNSRDMYQKYIHGSAEVVGLMCLKVFVGNDQKMYEELKPYAIKLGSAFQKINFLRDIQDDFERLGRSYFPNVNWKAFTDQEKIDVLAEIKAEFDEAVIGIRKLPGNCKLGVYVAYNYYRMLWKKLSDKSSKDILEKRTRIPDFFKLCILQKTQIKYHLGLI